MSDSTALASLQELLQGNNAVEINPGKTIGCRLDRFYVSPDIAKTLQATIHYFPYSDRDDLFLHFLLPCATTQGPGYWKLNTGILAEPAFFPQVPKLWEKWQQCKPKLLQPKCLVGQRQTETEGSMLKVFKAEGRHKFS